MTKRTTEITTLFLDIGGVLLTDGWDHHARKRATTFQLELSETGMATAGQRQLTRRLFRSSLYHL